MPPKETKGMKGSSSSSSSSANSSSSSSNPVGRPRTHPAAPFAPNQVVIVEWQDGHFYFARFLQESKGRCKVLFEDGSSRWTPRAKVHFEDESIDEIICIVCKKEASPANNEIVICDSCGYGYHQKCHTPIITSDVKESSNRWSCQFCNAGLTNPHVNVPFPVDVPSLPATSSSSATVRVRSPEPSQRKRFKISSGSFPQLIEADEALNLSSPKQSEENSVSSSELLVNPSENKVAGLLFEAAENDCRESEKNPIFPEETKMVIAEPVDSKEITPAVDLDSSLNDPLCQNNPNNEYPNEMSDYIMPSDQASQGIVPEGETNGDQQQGEDPPPHPSSPGEDAKLLCGASENADKARISLTSSSPVKVENSLAPNDFYPEEQLKMPTNNLTFCNEPSKNEPALDRTSTPTTQEPNEIINQPTSCEPSEPVLSTKKDADELVQECPSVTNTNSSLPLNLEISNSGNDLHEGTPHLSLLPEPLSSNLLCLVHDQQPMTDEHFPQATDKLTEADAETSPASLPLVTPLPIEEALSPRSIPKQKSRGNVEGKHKEKEKRTSKEKDELRSLDTFVYDPDVLGRSSTEAYPYVFFYTPSLQEQQQFRNALIEKSRLRVQAARRADPSKTRVVVVGGKKFKDPFSEFSSHELPDQPFGHVYKIPPKPSTSNKTAAPIPIAPSKRTKQSHVDQAKPSGPSALPEGIKYIVNSQFSLIEPANQRTPTSDPSNGVPEDLKTGPGDVTSHFSVPSLSRHPDPSLVSNFKPVLSYRTRSPEVELPIGLPSIPTRTIPMPPSVSPDANPHAQIMIREDLPLHEMQNTQIPEPNPPMPNPPLSNPTIASEETAPTAQGDDDEVEVLAVYQPTRPGSDALPDGALQARMLGGACFTCKKAAYSLCSGCRTAWFCNKSCLERGWPVHEAECRMAEASSKNPAAASHDPQRFGAYPQNFYAGGQYMPTQPGVSPQQPGYYQYPPMVAMNHQGPMHPPAYHQGRPPAAQNPPRPSYYAGHTHHPPGHGPPPVTPRYTTRPTTRHTAPQQTAAKPRPPPVSYYASGSRPFNYETPTSMKTHSHPANVPRTSTNPSSRRPTFASFSSTSSRISSEHLSVPKQPSVSTSRPSVSQSITVSLSSSLQPAVSVPIPVSVPHSLLPENRTQSLSSVVRDEELPSEIIQNPPPSQLQEETLSIIPPSLPNASDPVVSTPATTVPKQPTADSTLDVHEPSLEPQVAAPPPSTQQLQSQPAPLNVQATSPLPASSEPAKPSPTVSSQPKPSAPPSSTSSLTCSVCGKKAGYTCLCRKVHYCSRPCQTKGWPVHRPYCTSA